MIAETEPLVTEGSVTFRLPDADSALNATRLLPALSLPGTDLDFEFADGLWQLELPRPGVHRMEYRLRLHHRDGSDEEICDPGNTLRAPGAFGDKSVIEFPGYVPPAWLGADQVPGETADLAVPAPLLARDIAVRVWSPAPVDEPLPLLVAHDGPEYDRLAGLTAYAAAMIAAGDLPPFRVALLAPGERDDEYAANPRYAATLHQRVLPLLRTTLAVTEPVVGMGASLGGLAMLHAQRALPGLFGGLFLQSASFLTVDLDPQEQHRFGRFGQVSVYVADVLRTVPHETVPVVMTCGTAEENLANNRQMAVTLTKQGYDARLVEVPDAHNYVAWRDAFDPALTALLRAVWSG
ncbi:alpha/beta hydrolase [Actinophytocola algeriensis]|uniref:Enterochelin esterase family protein n=1 Tax=Actinophytocola algeriensis TaxID=1768010 RepID=A0A7W7Q9V2_9PSEU|nr:alpha/beta hydrolase-fold protein [Actinophytocola algeriensis]MBB4909711.1 enterochelin esterase family protein [Actinophytocola algeriensis]MBE1475701.1 enterochelin esterase family protein [Actinophytocola algeriensis]